MCEIGIIYFVLSCCMSKRIYDIYIYNIYMYVHHEKSDIEHFKWPYPAMMTQCSTYQAPKNTHRNLKTGLLAEFLAQIWQIFSHVPSSPINPLTDFSQIFSQVPSSLTDFSQILIADFSQISHRFLKDFLQISHRFLTDFSQTSHRFFPTHGWRKSLRNLWFSWCFWIFGGWFKQLGFLFRDLKMRFYLVN